MEVGGGSSGFEMWSTQEMGEKQRSRPEPSGKGASITEMGNTGG